MGEFLTLRSDKSWLQTEHLLRRGKLDCVASAPAIRSPGTIIHLRAGPDRLHLPASVVQRAAGYPLERHDATDRQVRHRPEKVVSAFQEMDLPFRY